MNEYELIGALMPSHPELSPIINFLREKYSLAEINPEDDGITNITS